MANPVIDEYEDKDTSTEDVLKKCRERFKLADEYWRDDRDAALDDIKFRSGEQWPDDIVAQRSRDKRPVLTVDKLNQYVRQIVNDGRQNRPAIKVHPVDSKADIATSEILAGVIKHIESASNADVAYDTALDSAATCGFGYFTVTTDYSGEETFDQELKIKRVRNPLSIIIDPNSEEADGSDMKFAFEVSYMSKDVFNEKYPNKIPADFETNSVYDGWFGDQVRIARYWEVREEDKTMYLMMDGSVINKAQYDGYDSRGIEIASLVKESRNIPVRTVWHSIISGKEYLEEPQEWKGKYIPICVVWGNEIDIEGKVTHSGIIRSAKDAQRLYNYSRTAFAERVALTPKAPWIAAAGQIENYEDEWSTANSMPHQVLRYDPITLNGVNVPPPQRISPSDTPSGFQADMQISEHDIQGAIGMYASSLGAPSNERSGKAIMARQREGDTGTFHYHDNLNRAIRYCGRILVDLIPKVYDSERIVRIMGYDGAVSEASVDPNQPTASQKIGLKMVYNFDVGVYDVTITSGPSYNTLRAEAAESMTTMVQARPELMNVIGDLMVKNMDWPGAEEIAKRLHMILPPPILQAEQQEKQNQMPPEMQQAMQQFDMAMQQKDQMLQQASAQIQQLIGEMEKLKQGHDIKAAEVQIKAKEAEISQFEADTDRLKVTLENGVDEVQNLLKTHEIRVKELLMAHEQAQSAKTAADAAYAEDGVERAESADSTAQIAALIQQSNEQTMQSISMIAQAMQEQTAALSRPVTKQGRAVRQPDGSYTMESVEAPVGA
jgi:hypothetical protein